MAVKHDGNLLQASSAIGFLRHSCFILSASSSVLLSASSSVLVFVVAVGRQGRGEQTPHHATCPRLTGMISTNADL
jgi:hypothetical protein